MNFYEQAAGKLRILRELDSRVEDAMSRLDIRARSASDEARRLESLIAKQAAMIEYFGQFLGGTYFYEPENPESYWEPSCFEVVEYDYLKYKYDESEAYQAKAQFAAKAFASVTGEKHLDLFELISSTLDQTACYEEIAFTYACVYDHLKLYSQSLFWLQLLRRKYPSDQLLFVKLTRLCCKMGNHAELEQLLVIGRLVTIEPYRDLLQAITVDYHLAVGAELGVVSPVSWRLHAKQSNSFTVNLTLLNYFTVREPHQRFAGANYRIVIDEVKWQNRSIRDCYYHDMYQACGAAVAELGLTRKGLSASRGLSLSGGSSRRQGQKEVSSRLRSNRLFIGNQNTHFESARKKKYNADLGGQFGVSRDDTDRVAELMRTSPEAKLFCEGFLTECRSLYAAGTDSGATTPVGSPDGSLPYTLIVGLFRQWVPESVSGKMGLLTVYAKKSFRESHSASVSRFASDKPTYIIKVTKVLTGLLLTPGFLDVVRCAGREMREAGLEALFDFARSKSLHVGPEGSFRKLGVVLAVHLINSYVLSLAKARAGPSAMIANCLRELQTHCRSLSLPPLEAFKSSRFSAFYFGFLQMALLMSGAASRCLTQRAPDDPKIVLLCSGRDQEAPGLSAVVDAARSIHTLFGNQRSAARLVERCFRMHGAGNKQFSRKLRQILDGMYRYEFGVDDLWTELKRRARCMQLHYDKDLYSLLQKNGPLASRVGAVCAFSVTSCIELDEIREGAEDCAVARRFGKLQFAKKGWLWRLLSGCGGCYTAD